MKQLVVLTILCGSLILGGCAAFKKSANNSALLLQYQLDGTNQTSLVNLSKSYGSTLSRSLKDKHPEPGECADYAVTLAKLNHPAEANNWFNLEMYYHPASAPLVYKLKQQLTPMYANDTSTNASVADLSAFDSLANPMVATDGGTSIAEGGQAAPAPKVKLTKKEKKKMARQKAKAKKKAKREKAKAKKAKEKAKKNAKKAAAKQKEQAREERAALRREAANQH